MSRFRRKVSLWTFVIGVLSFVGGLVTFSAAKILAFTGLVMPMFLFGCALIGASLVSFVVSYFTGGRDE